MRGIRDMPWGEMRPEDLTKVSGYPDRREPDSRAEVMNLRCGYNCNE
jgi:hypothetical protein